MDQPISPNQPIQSPISSAPPVAAVVPVTPIPPKKSYKWLVIALFIFLLSAASVFAYKYYQLKSQTAVVTPSPTPNQVISPELTFEQDVPIDPTADWKTYTNKEYNFTIKYPTDAKLRVNQPESTDRMMVVAFDSPSAVFDHLFKSGGYSFELSMQTNSNFNNIDDFLSFQIEHSMYEGVSSKTYNNVKGYLFNQQKGFSGQNFTHHGFVTKNNDLFYTVNYFTDNNSNIFDQILSTFKFTN